MSPVFQFLSGELPLLISVPHDGRDLPEEMRREKASDYGLVYVFRKSEMSNVNLFQTSRVEGIG